MRWISVLGVALALVISLTGLASAQGLPQSVAEPYVRYQEAQEAGDLVAAQAAAGEAYNAAIAARIDRATTGVLAEIYGFLASQNGDDGIAFDVLRTAAEIAEETGATASDRAWRWSLAAEAASAFGQSSAAMRNANASLAALAETGTISEADRPIAADMHYLRMRLLRAQGDIPAAGAAATEALAAFRADQREFDGQYGLIFYNLGVADYAAGRWADAHVHYRLAVVLLNAADAPEQSIWSAWAFAELSRVLSNEDGAAGAPHPNAALHAELADQRLAALRRLERYDYLEMDGFQEAVVAQAGEVVFPESAAGQQGFVVVRFDVNAQGRPENLHLVFEQPADVFGTYAIGAIAQRLYTPAQVNGVAIDRSGMLQLVMFADGEATAADYSFSTGDADDSCGFVGSARRETAALNEDADPSCLARQGDLYDAGYRGGIASNRCPNPGQCGGQ